MNTGRSPPISTLPSISPIQSAHDIHHEDLILAGGAKRSFYSQNPKPPTASWSDFRNRHLYQMQEKARIERTFVTTTTDDTTSPSSSTSEGEGSIAETDLMVHNRNPSERRKSIGHAVRPPKPPRITPSIMDISNLATIEASDLSRSSSSKYSSGITTPAPPPPPMPPMTSFAKNSRHLGHVTGITETLQNRMANAAVSAASEARARKTSKL